MSYLTVLIRIRVKVCCIFKLYAKSWMSGLEVEQKYFENQLIYHKDGGRIVIERALLLLRIAGCT